MIKLPAVTFRIPRQVWYFGALTWLLSFGYQAAFYGFYRATGSEFLQGQRDVWSYYSGIIGDGVFVPLINMFVLLLLRELKPTVTLGKIVSFFLLGLITTLAIHYVQASFALTNWAMPRPFFWSGVGRFHFLFMWTEFSFLFFTLGEVVRHLNRIYNDRRELELLGGTWASIALFLATFVIDYAHILAPVAVLAHWR